MDNLIFCLNATVPVFLMMLLGFILAQVFPHFHRFCGKFSVFFLILLVSA